MPRREPRHTFDHMGSVKRVIIAGTGSGCGKTTVTCAVLAALKARGLKVSAFKCGPDYIDPGFHREVIGVPSRNLDSFFCDDDTIRYLLSENSKDSDISVIEGVMGFYDGADGRGSAHSISVITDTPAVVVIDCRGMSDSIGAVMKGFLEFRKPNNISGFIFNRLPEKLCGLAKNLCGEMGVRYLGYLPRTDFVIESRHLGLMMAEEIVDIKEKLESLAVLAEKTILLDEIMELPQRDIPGFSAPRLERCGSSPVIAVARDRAFCFIYEDNIDLLKKIGCKIRYFSPIDDDAVPGDADGIILSGGYPELYSEKLSSNKKMLADIRSKISSGMPAIAECGGFMYLHSSFEDMDGLSRPGVGIIDGKAFKTQKLQRFGYITMTAGKDGMLCPAGGKIKAHEFHYFDSDRCGNGMTAVKVDGRSWSCVNVSDRLYAGFPHLYFYSDPGIASRFAAACAEYAENKK